MEINNDKYKVTTKYPLKKDFNYITTTEEILKDEDELEYTITNTSKRFDRGAFEKAKADFEKESKEKYLLFENDFFEYHGIEDKPWKKIVLDFAWERGHSSGYAEVINCGYDAVEFAERVAGSLKSNE